MSSLAPHTTTKHQWVRYSMSPVDVIVDPFSEVCSVVEVPGSRVGSQIGCEMCGTPLTDGTAPTCCPGSLDA